jgi:hypothetical protein
MHPLAAVALVAALAVAGEEPVPEPRATVPDIPGPGAPPPDDLIAIRIGEPYDALDGRLDLRTMVPLHEGDAVRYVLDPGMPVTRRARADLATHGVRRLDLRLRGGRVDRVRVEFDGRDAEMFDQVGEELRRRYGEPARVAGRGPMQVGRAHGVRLYYWIRVWTWDWPGRRLVVQGEHYGDDKRLEQPLRHTYTYTLEGGSFPPVTGSAPAGRR